MKNLILIVVGSVLLTGCEIISNTQKILNIHPAAQPYVERFEKVTGVHVDNLEVVFRDFSECSRDQNGRLGCVMAYCQRSTETSYSSLGLKKTETEHNLIVISTRHGFSPDDDSDKTNTNIAASREELIFHEMGHCVLKRGHTDENAFSLMVPYHFGADQYLSSYGAYMSELVNPGNASYSGQYAGYTPTDGTYASKSFPEFVDRGEEIQVLGADELQDGDFHETHTDTVIPESTDTNIESQD